MTEPGAADDADRAEQEALLEPAAPVLAGDVEAIGDAVPEADALEQQLATAPGAAGTPGPVGDRDANEADVLEQEADVPLDEDERTY